MIAVTIMLKDLRLIARDRVAVAAQLLVPMVVIWIVAASQSGPGTRSIVLPVVNEDQGPVATALVRVLREHLDVREVTRPVAEQWVAVDNSAPAALVLPTGTSKRYLTGKPSTIELLTDPAQWTALEAIKVVLLLADRDAASLGDPLHEDLLVVQERSLTGTRLSFSSLEQQIPGFSLMFVLMTLLFSVAFGLREEEVWGTSGRLAVAPVAPVTVLGGKLLARLVASSAQLLVLLLFGHVVYGLALGRSPFLLVLLVATIVFSMASFALVVAAFTKTREQIIPVVLSVVFLLASLGGLWWPFHEQPAWMQVLARGAMTTWSMFALQDVILRDKGLMDVAPVVLLLITYGIVCFAIGLRVFRYGGRGRL